MAMTLWEAKKEIAAWAYDVGRYIGGDSYGGIVKDFLAKDGPIATRKILMAAIRSADPKSYIGGAIRKRNQKKIEETPIGFRSGMYEWSGTAWIEWIEKYDYDKLSKEEKERNQGLGWKNGQAQA